MTSADFEQLAQSIEPATLVVEPRVLQRIIRLDRGIQGFRLSVPHRESYTIERDRLLSLVDRKEIGADAETDLPPRLILLSKLDEDDPSLANADKRVVDRYTRRLFHACVHLELENKFSDLDTLQVLVNARRKQIGKVEFAEIRSVLLKDDYLFESSGDSETYVEFVALYSELRCFAPHELLCYFPAIRDWQEIERIVGQDINYQQLLDRFHLSAEVDPLQPESDALYSPDTPSANGSPLRLPAFQRFQARADRAAAAGNSVKAILVRWRAAQSAPPEYQVEANTAVQLELSRLVHRIQHALQLPAEEAEQWAAALKPFLGPASRALFNNEARLLYDLQKVCVEQERKIHRINLMEWVLSLGKRPFDRPLPLLCEALVLRHLRTTRRRISSARVDATSRQLLASLVDNALPLVESRFRCHLRDIMTDVFDRVGLHPQNVPERVARQKAIEELTDQIVERSYLRMADFRDALSKNDLKLPDVEAIADVIKGDRLLQADEEFDTALDGVYRRGAIYQRWPQTLSSLAFGTRIGRNLTQYLVVPYGGAFLILECLRHLGLLPTGQAHGAAAPISQGTPHSTASTSNDFVFVSTVLLFGTWLSFLIHRPDFLAWNAAQLKKIGRASHRLLIELPASILRSQTIQQILNSYAFKVLGNYLFRPALFTASLWILAHVLGYRWSNRLILEVFLIAALFLNSAFGRYIVDVVTNYLVRVWNEVKIRVVASVIQWIMDLFRGLLITLERIVYVIDEWLRFRSGDERAVRILKLTGGVFWFFIAYLVIFVFTLLVEPQINPIKHFPVVTVSHKLILPTGPVIVQHLAPYLGGALANTLVWTTIWLIPGVFGFLVWELKENWRLYSANRSRVLRAESVGNHGETMLQLLRPGFHSGTLPKAFAALRRASRKATASNSNRLRRRWATIHRVEQAVKQFVDREFICLLQEIGLMRDVPISVAKVHASTNRIDVQLASANSEEQPICLTWEDLNGHLTGTFAATEWFETLDRSQRDKISNAVAGLMQRSGVEQVKGITSLAKTPTIAWSDWVAMWPAAKEQLQIHFNQSPRLNVPCS